MTQKYIPVEWTDETPTQPGTLINKARLDQMQSAHHFADGFEEVDAIPTEDPGTDYHKVVYCTADTTFYRWDGAQWTADIDDDTKRLLLEHEADHSNPHQVTKAQVGLGNADNTSDADKPISTATQAALDGKVDKLGSSPAGSYTKVTVNAQGQVTAGSNPATLAEAGITDAYTKAQVDTKLGDGSVTKLGTANVGSDTLPIKLVGGSPTPVANELMDLATEQTVTANKTYIGLQKFNQVRLATLREQSVGTGNAGSWRVMGKVALTSGQNVRAKILALANQSNRMAVGEIYISYTAPTVNIYASASFDAENIAVNYDGAGNAIILMKTLYIYQSPRSFPIYVQKTDAVDSAAIDYSDTTTYADPSAFPYANTAYGAYTNLRLNTVTETTGTFSMQAANSNKLKNELDAYLPMVRTAGNQTKAGILTLTNQPIMALGGTGARLSSTSNYLHFGTVQSSIDTNYTVPVIIFERGGLVMGDIAITVSGGAVTTVLFSGKTIVGSSTRVFVGAATSSNGVELYCHSDTVNRYFVANILGAMSGSGYGQRVAPAMEIEDSTPAGYVEAAFTEA